MVFVFTDATDNVSVFNIDRCVLLNDQQLHHVYARHPGGGEWDMQCEGWYEPDVDEIVQLSR